MGVLLLTLGAIGFGCLGQEVEVPASVGFVFGLGDRRVVAGDAVASGLVTLGADRWGRLVARRGGNR